MRFTKMQGVGNDFVVVDAAILPPEMLLSDLAIRTCDRHTGIGADGLLVVSQDVPEAAFRMRMFNPDGTEDMCGNGLRCVGLWAWRAGWLGERSKLREFIVQTLDGPKTAVLRHVSTKFSVNASLGVEMGPPHLEPSRIPFAAEVPGGRVVDWPLTVAGHMYTLTAVNTGSTHAVIFGPAPDEDTFQTVSPLIENHALLPSRTSVLWATPEGESVFGDPQFRIRIWERGVGETLGCGTGACAVGVAAVLRGLSCPGQPINIISPGGALLITWPGEAASVNMIGSAYIVYDGDYAL